jgi:lysophospholipase L1-like esterase
MPAFATMKRLRASFALTGTFALAACGGGGPSGPTPLPPDTHTLSVLVFYDENANGVLDPEEAVRLPDVTARAGQLSARTGEGGVATLQGLPAGTYTVTLQADSLPAFWQAGESPPVAVPQTAQALVPVTLPIAGNRPNVYMAFGDSITVGYGANDGTGYRVLLEQRLAAHFGRATIVDEGVSATRSNRGAARVVDSLNGVNAAYILIHYGTNDWNDAACKNIVPCFTIQSLAQMVREAKFVGTLPVLATILPVNVGYDARVPESRQVWVSQQDEYIRELAAEEGALLVDLERAFLAQPDLGQLFFDHIHPNDAGYQIMADTFFEALLRPRGTSAAAAFVASGPSSLAPLLRDPRAVGPQAGGGTPARPSLAARAARRR